MATTVIVGGVAGGMSTAARLRRNDEHREIIVFEASGNVSFANCGLPYHVGGIIPERSSLLLQTPESLGARFRIDVRTHHRVTAINPDAHEVTVDNLRSGETFTQTYDELVLSPGARPFIPPIPGIERALSLRTVERRGCHHRGAGEHCTHRGDHRRRIHRPRAGRKPRSPRP